MDDAEIVVVGEEDEEEAAAVVAAAAVAAVAEGRGAAGKRPSKALAGKMPRRTAEAKEAGASCVKTADTKGVPKVPSLFFYN